MTKHWRRFCLWLVFTKSPLWALAPNWVGPWLMDQGMGMKGVRIDKVKL